MKYLITNLLINEPPLQVLPSLAKEIGLNEAIVVQQIHFWTRLGKNQRDGFSWVYKTFDEWHEEFPFWSVRTIKRTIKKLEDTKMVVSTGKYNRIIIDRTKWYRVNYAKLEELSSGQNGTMVQDKMAQRSGQNGTMSRDKMAPPITIEYTENTTEKNNVELELDFVQEIINYLNNKANKHFKASSNATKKLISGRIRDGYTLEDFKNVIDIKTKQWLTNPDMNKYLQPSTLFNATKFENYLNEGNTLESNIKNVSSNPLKAGPLNLDFNAGEDIR